jgi:hypothetical protein
VLFHAACENQGHTKRLRCASQRTGIVPDEFLRDAAAPAQGSDLVINGSMAVFAAVNFSVFMFVSFCINRRGSYLFSSPAFDFLIYILRHACRKKISLISVRCI